jgi:O-antigen/teichoic acid export membrane protein
VVGIMLAEQALMNAAVLIVNADSGRALAGFVFNVLLIVRAPLQLFQAVQTSLLPHLAGGGDAARAIRVTVLAIAAFASAVALGLLAVGPWAMDVLFGDIHDYDRAGLALLAAGMGFHLVAGTLNQALLAAGRAAAAAASWLATAAAFVAFMVLAPIDDRLLRTEAGYLAAAVLLVALLVGQRLQHVEPGGAAGRDH